MTGITDKRLDELDELSNNPDMALGFTEMQEIMMDQR